MFEPDEYIFTKFAHFFKRRSKRREAKIPHAVRLNEIKPRLLLFARAVTGEPIEIFEAEQEGGYKNNNYFLPEVFFILSYDSREYFILSVSSSISFHTEIIGPKLARG